MEEKKQVLVITWIILLYLRRKNNAATKGKWSKIFLKIRKAIKSDFAEISGLSIENCDDNNIFVREYDTRKLSKKNVSEKSLQDAKDKLALLLLEKFNKYSDENEKRILKKIIELKKLKTENYPQYKISLNVFKNNLQKHYKMWGELNMNIALIDGFKLN